MAGQEGLEPPTLGFGDRCSAELSYWPLLAGVYRTSLWTVRLRSNRQYFFISRRSGVSLLFRVVV